MYGVLSEYPKQIPLWPQIGIRIRAQPSVCSLTRWRSEAMRSYQDHPQYAAHIHKDNHCYMTITL